MDTSTAQLQCMAARGYDMPSVRVIGSQPMFGILQVLVSASCSYAQVSAGASTKCSELCTWFHTLCAALVSLHGKSAALQYAMLIR